MANVKRRAWADPVNKIVQVLLCLANIADEKEETPFEKEMGLGYRAFSSYVREGVMGIVELQREYYDAKENARSEVMTNLHMARIVQSARRFG